MMSIGSNQRSQTTVADKILVVIGSIPLTIVYGALTGILLVVDITTMDSTHPFFRDLNYTRLLYFEVFQAVISLILGVAGLIFVFRKNNGTYLIGIGVVLLALIAVDVIWANAIMKNLVAAITGFGFIFRLSGPLLFIIGGAVSQLRRPSGDLHDRN